MSTNKILRINIHDNVAIALQPLSEGDEYFLDDNTEPLALLNNIPYTHKVAIRPIKKDEKIIKYGSPIGSALYDIKPGEHVHSHNMKSNY
ncbi:UxaA family hydrolase [Pedobacter sp. SYSU D00535]|uniref:UxaA family hydrolase n=1 Tax=Pedobacter sp. SYSU D00535 TaxID=2810308 RepID=UPI001A95AC5D|nr:UxaA family hydrolase [Pedobacter sp. SYSU D00535]